MDTCDLTRTLRGAGCFALVLLLGVCLLAPSAQADNRVYWANYDVDVDPMVPDPADHSISWANVDGSGGGDLRVTGAPVNGPMGMAMDPAIGKIYWADWGADGSGTGTTISWANLDGSGGGQLPIASGMVNGPHGLAIDPVAGKIYWPNFATNTISYANLDGSDAANLNTTGATVQGPRGLAIDPAAGKIYWANYGPGLSGTGTQISYARLNGTGGGNLITMGATVEGPEGVAIDAAAGKIYWGNYGPDPPQPGTSDTIAYANLDGTGGAHNLNTAPAVPNRPHGVALDPDAGKLYWADYGGWVIHSVNLTGGGGDFVHPMVGATIEGPVLPVLLDVPKPTGAPAIGGGSALGSTLSCSQGGWAADLVAALLYRAPQSFSYQWSLDGKNLAGATSTMITARTAGAYQCRVTARNAAGPTIQTSSPHTIVGSNVFTVGRVTRNQRKGTATIAVRVPGSGRISLAEGIKLKRVVRHPRVPEKLSLVVKPRGRTARDLRRRGALIVRPKIIFIPTGGTASRQRPTIRLVERPRP